MAKTRCNDELSMRICMACRYNPEPTPDLWGRLRNWYNRRAWWWRGL